MMLQVINQEATEALKSLQGQSVDLTVTSPPYDDMRTYNDSERCWSEQVWKRVLTELHHVTRAGGVVVWIVGDATRNGSETGTSFRQALFAKEVGFNLHDTMIWNKNSFSAVGSLKTRYAPVFEYMFIFSKGKPKTFNPIKDRPNKTAGQSVTGTNVTTNRESRKMPCYGNTIAEYGQRHNIWHMPAEMNRQIKHPAPFPLSIAKDHIHSWSNEGDTVLDPFMGSGTTGLACKELGRGFIGIEISEDYCEMAKARIGDVG